MKKIIFITACLLYCNLSAYTQKISAEAKKILKENADMVKSLKKQMNLKTVDVEFEENGNWHYSVTAKTGWMGIVDKSGRTIIEPYYFNLKYIPALPEGTEKFTPEGLYQEEVRIWHPARPAHYVGNPGKARTGAIDRDGIIHGFQLMSIIDTNGKVLKADIDYYLTPIPGYYAVGARHLESSYGALSVLESGHKVGLMTSLGDMILEPEYDSYFIRFDKDCRTTKWIDNIKKQGGVNLEKPNVVVPCIFESVDQNAEGQWIVQANMTSKKTIWHPGDSKQMSYRDEGEKLYDQFRFDDVIKYYSNEGVRAPWAKFFSGSSLYRNANSAITQVKNFSRDVVSYKMSDVEIPAVDFQQIYNQLDFAKSLLELYNQMDDEFTELANKEITYSEELMEELKNGSVQNKYNEALGTLRELRIQQQQAWQEEQLRRQQAAQQFVNTMNTLMNNIQSGMNTSRTSSTVRQKSYSETSTSSSVESDKQYKKSVKKQITCETCGGNKKCSVCKGSGKSKATYKNGDHKTCDACNGSGKCFICDGKGYKERWMAE